MMRKSTIRKVAESYEVPFSIAENFCKRFDCRTEYELGCVLGSYNMQIRNIPEYCEPAGV